MGLSLTIIIWSNIRIQKLFYFSSMECTFMEMDLDTWQISYPKIAQLMFTLLILKMQENHKETARDIMSQWNHLSTKLKNSLS